MPDAWTNHRLTGVAAVIAAALLLPAASAHGAVRYASHTSSDTLGGCATVVAACALEHAIEGANPNDEIIVLPGTYNIGTASIAPVNPVSIHGQDPASRPTIIGGPDPLQGSVLEVQGSTVQDLRVESTSAAIAIALQESSTGDRLIGIAAGGSGDANGIQLRNGTNTLHDSLARSNAPSGAALQMKDGTNTAVGVTAVGTDGADGLTTKVVTGSAVVKNSIVTGSVDYHLSSGAEASFSSSNWRRANSNAGIDAGGNDAAAPVFCAADGLYRPASTSPTRDAGIVVAGGTGKDLDGVTRPLGDGVDMGAYEWNGCVATSDTGQTGQTGDTGADSGSPRPGGENPSALPPASDPVLGASVTLAGVRGTPRVRLPGSKTFVPLTADSTVPVGAVVDARRGAVDLTSVRDRSGKTQTGRFWGGVFRVAQSKRDGVTELVLAGGGAANCGRARRAARTDVSASRSRRRWSRRLWARDRGGRFRTRGRHGSATVRGTRWLTEDRCGGTLFRVTEGAIDVRDKARRKTVRVKRGKSYLAKAKPTAGKKPRRAR